MSLYVFRLRLIRSFIAAKMPFSISHLCLMKAKRSNYDLLNIAINMVVKIRFVTLSLSIDDCNTDM